MGRNLPDDELFYFATRYEGRGLNSYVRENPPTRCLTSNIRE